MKERLRELFRIRKLSQLPFFGRALVVLFSLLFALVLWPLDQIQERKNGGEKTK